MSEYVMPPVPEVIRNVSLHFLLGAVSGALASAALGARRRELAASFFVGGLGGALPDIDHPLTGGRTFGHGTPAKALGAEIGFVAITIGSLLVAADGIIFGKMAKGFK